MGSAYRLFYDRPVHLVRGEGAWLWDAGGRKYLDMYNNVPHVGHCHPRVVQAICEQAARLNTHTRYLHELVLDLADRLTAKLPGALDGNTVRVQTDRPLEIVASLAACRGRITHLKVDRPDLEAVFLTLTGRSLRD